ncbi:MAG: hypothetical protein AB7T59_10310 [Hyphomonadaceae bacterium]
MRYVARAPDQTALCEPVAASLQRWLVLLIAWFCDVLEAIPPAARRSPFVRAAIAAAKARIARDLRMSVRALGHMLIIHTLARMNFASRRTRQRLFPGGAGRGLRVAHRYCTTRLLARTLSGMHEGSLRQRAERLAAALDNLEPLIARMLKRWRVLWRHVRAPALIFISADAEPLQCARGPAPPRADTS